jgi:hypothetical protein
MSKLAFSLMMGWKAGNASDEMKYRFQRVRLAQRFTGWTLDYIDTLSQQDVLDIYGVLEAEGKYNHVQQQKANTQRRAAARRGRKR